MTLGELKTRYSHIEKVKRGGQKTVYKATATTGETVALKIIASVSDPRVLQEITLVQGISHSNIPCIFESGIVRDTAIDEDVLYIVEEFIDGCSMRDWISAGNLFDLRHAYDILHRLLEIEIELESKQILHRDINPNNIMFSNDNRLYLIDFGLAKNLNGISLTRTAAVNGPFTPGYAPYEQFANMKMHQDVRTDLFQIGVTIYEGCFGKNPFVGLGETPFQIMSRTLTMVPPSLRLAGDTKGLFSQFIGMLMAKNQSQRPDTAVDAMRYLNAIHSSLDMEV